MSDDWKRGLMRPYQDIDCTIPAVNPGDKVAAWKNDAGVKIVQPSPDKQPTIRTELEVLRENYAALRARHEKLVEGCKALVEEWRDTANYGTDPDKSAAERLLFDTVHAHADELNALLEDEST